MSKIKIEKSDENDESADNKKVVKTPKKKAENKTPKTKSETKSSKKKAPIKTTSAPARKRGEVIERTPTTKKYVLQNKNSNQRG